MWKGIWTAISNFTIKVVLYLMIRKAGKDAAKREQSKKTLENIEKAKKARENHEKDPETIRRKWDRGA